MAATIIDINDHLAARDEPDDHLVEAVAHAILRLAADFPAQLGRLRACRVIAGAPGAWAGDVAPPDLEPYAVETGWPRAEILRLLDALIEGGLLHRTGGPRPTLVLTRAGFRALEALESIES